MDEAKRICKRCLLQDFAPEEYLENMRIYIQGLDEDIKTDQDTYQERINICQECSNLNEGICRLCGCFVEYRAAIKTKKCPEVHSKW